MSETLIVPTPEVPPETPTAPDVLWKTVDWVTVVLKQMIRHPARKRRNLRPVHFGHQPRICYIQIKNEHEPFCIFDVKLACGILIPVAGVFSEKTKLAFVTWCRSKEIYVPTLVYTTGSENNPGLLQKAVEHLRQLIKNMAVTLNEGMRCIESKHREHHGRFSRRYCERVAPHTAEALAALP